MGMAIGGPGAVPGAEMNVTPLIDVLLVLIIIFMIIIPPSKTKGLEAQIPQDAKPTDTAIERKRTVVVQIFRSAGSEAVVKINEEPVTWDHLYARLRDIYKTRAERVMFVQADPELSFDPVAQVIDAAHMAFPDIRVGLITAKIQTGN